MLDGAKSWFSNLFSKWWVSWLIGLLLLLAISVGGTLLKVKGLVAIAAWLSGLGAFGLMIGLMASFVAPAFLATVKKALFGENRPVLLTFGLALVVAGAVFALAYFALPALLASKVTFFAGTTGKVISVLSAVTTTLTALMAVLSKRGYPPKKLWETKGKIAETIILGFGSASVGVMGLIGTPFALPVVASIVFIFVGALALSGFFSGVGGALMDWKKGKTKSDLETPAADPSLLGGKQTQTPKPAADPTAAAAGQQNENTAAKQLGQASWMNAGAGGGPPQQQPAVGPQGSIN